MNKRKLFLFLLIGIVAASAGPENVYSQHTINSDNWLARDDSEREELLLLFEESQLVVTPTKLEQKISDIPATVYAVTEEEIRKHGYQTLDEVLRDLPGFDFINSAGWWGMTSFQRGIRGNKTPLILIDGVRDDNLVDSYQIWGQTYMLAAVKKIEVVYGPSSALYGADAFSGVVNIITKDGYDIKGADVNLIGGSFGTKIYELTAGNQIRDKNIDWSLWGRWVGADGPKLGDLADYPFLKDTINGYGDPNFRNYKNKTENYTFGFKSSVSGFTFGAYQWDRENGGGTLFIPTGFVQNQSVSHYRNTGLYLKKYQEISSQLHSQTVLSYLRTDVINDSYLLVISSTTPFTTTPVFQMGNADRASLEQQFIYYFSPQHYSIGGITLENWLVAPRVQNKYFPPDRGKGLTYYPREVYGLYLQDEYKFRELLNFIIGGRYDYTYDFGSTFNPRTGVVYHLIPQKSSLKFLYGESFLAPSYYDRYYSDLTNTTTVVVANPDLAPQKVRTLEASWDWRFSRYLRTEINLFKNYLSNAIVRSSTGLTTSDGVPIDKFINRGKIESEGAELGLSGDLGKLINFYTNYSYLSGRNITEGIPFLEDTAKHKANAGVNFFLFDFLRWNVSLNWYGRRFTSLRNTVFHGGKMSGYTLVNTNFIIEDILPNLALSLRIKNLLDRQYFDPADRGSEGWVTPLNPQERRSLFLEASYHF